MWLSFGFFTAGAAGRNYCRNYLVSDERLKGRDKHRAGSFHDSVARFSGDSKLEFPTFVALEETPHRQAMVPRQKT